MGMIPTDDRNLYVCSFYSDKFQYKFAAYRFRKQINKIGLITISFIYDQSQFFSIIAHKYANLIKIFGSEKDKPGFAWFAWKPIIILESLKSMPEDSILLYADIGCNLKANFNYWDSIIAKTKSSGMVTANSRGAGINQLGNKELTWTKREVLEKLRMNEDDKNSPQYQATWIMIVNNKDNRTFVQEWVEMCTFEDFLLIKPTDEVSTQNSNFVRHSHDQ